jgi:hypothetical protein
MSAMMLSVEDIVEKQEWSDFTADAFWKDWSFR